MVLKAIEGVVLIFVVIGLIKLKLWCEP